VLLNERYPRVARYYDLSYDPQAACLVVAFNADKHATAERLGYLLKTNRMDLSGDELWRIYVLLTRAENAFRDMKSPLAEWPIFHQLEQRVEAHIFLCVLAYHLLISIEKTLLDRGSILPGQRCAKPSKPIRSAPSCCPPAMARPCVFERPQPPNPTSSTSTAPSPSAPPS
jgi:hypothetical protein